MTNNSGMHQSAAEIVKILGGVNATARFFGLKPPSVTEWVKSGAVPDERLIPKAALIESVSDGTFSRVAQFPDRWREIWPELADSKPNQPPTPTHQALAAINSETEQGAAHG